MSTEQLEQIIEDVKNMGVKALAALEKIAQANEEMNDANGLLAEYLSTARGLKNGGHYKQAWILLYELEKVYNQINVKNGRTPTDNPAYFAQQQIVASLFKDPKIRNAYKTSGKKAGYASKISFIDAYFRK